ncbi:unnamed protein product [Pleuronectes platessa]|uniref:Uncharacterized protein n=1 Tax=Pleuronectes platessa TaxID=8262 RepID=A0A9N7YKF1_PLEPL|nr:unnamed protein product [Pleuronectes platessa]
MELEPEGSALTCSSRAVSPPCVLRVSSVSPPCVLHQMMELQLHQKHLLLTSWKLDSTGKRTARPQEGERAGDNTEFIPGFNGDMSRGQDVQGPLSSQGPLRRLGGPSGAQRAQRSFPVTTTNETTRIEFHLVHCMAGLTTWGPPGRLLVGPLWPPHRLMLQS